MREPPYDEDVFGVSYDAFIYDVEVQIMMHCSGILLHESFLGNVELHTHLLATKFSTSCCFGYNKPSHRSGIDRYLVYRPQTVEKSIRI